MISSSFVQIVRSLVNTRQTGYLKMRHGDDEGFLAVDNGTIVNARSGATTGLHALFRFVGWREARMEFHERPIPGELSRDLAVYEPQVLITGLVAKVEELCALEQAIPGFDLVLRYIGGGAHGSVEATPADLGLLSLADGQRTVREIAEMVMLNPLEVARCFARFRSTGVLESLPGKAKDSALAGVAL